MHPTDSHRGAGMAGVLPDWLNVELLLALVVLLALLGAIAWARARRWWRRQQETLVALQESEERLSLALRSSRDELWDLDLISGRLQRINAMAGVDLPADMTFHAFDEYLDRVHPDDRPRLHRAYVNHLKGQTEFYEAIYRMRCDDGSYRWALSRGQVVARDTSAKALRMVGTNRDVSDILARDEELERLNGQLSTLNDALEGRVEERTRALKQANHELEFTVDELRLAQRQLVESEKMAALGNLVAGIAHEINTPLGIGVTAASHLETEARRMEQAMASGALKRSDLDRFTDEARTSTSLILANLSRACKLVGSFKQVAVDQSDEAAREIDLRRYLEEVLISLQPAMKKAAHKIELKCAEGLQLYTYPGALAQIVVNLVMNSLSHAFEGIDNGQMLLHCETYDEEWLLLYRDNGVGMSEEVRSRVFEPFFTTRRGQGGSGLGMHIVYNLVTQLLHGSIDCISAPGEGVEIQIQLPMRASPDVS